jgi:hypothetical protein
MNHGEINMVEINLPVVQLLKMLLTHLGITLILRFVSSPVASAETSQLFGRIAASVDCGFD